MKVLSITIETDEGMIQVTPSSVVNETSISALDFFRQAFNPNLQVFRDMWGLRINRQDVKSGESPHDSLQAAFLEKEAK